MHLRSMELLREDKYKGLSSSMRKKVTDNTRKEDRSEEEEHRTVEAQSNVGLNPPKVICNTNKKLHDYLYMDNNNIAQRT